MHLRLITEDALEVITDLQIVKHFDGMVGGAEGKLDDALGGSLQSALVILESSRFTNSQLVRVNQTNFIGSQNLLVLGLGSIYEFSLEELEAAMNHAIIQALENGCESIATPVIGISDHVGLPVERAYRTVLQSVVRTLLAKQSSYNQELSEVTIFDFSREKVEFFKRITNDILDELRVPYRRLSSGHYDIQLSIRRDGFNQEIDSDAAQIYTRSNPRTGKRIGNRLEIDSQVKILYLAANPKNTAPLRLDEEIREIDTAFRHAEYRNRFDIRQHFAVRVMDLQSHLLRHQPTIVHFSGHGSSSSKIFLEDITGQSQSVSSRALGQLFSVLRDNIKCVVLNACYSSDQALAIAEHIDCVVGMTSAIGDRAAISFATAFYQAIGYGRDIQTAFELGCVQIDMENLHEQDIPKLHALRIDPSQLRFA